MLGRTETYVLLSIFGKIPVQVPKKQKQKNKTKKKHLSCALVEKRGGGERQLNHQHVVQMHHNVTSILKWNNVNTFFFAKIDSGYFLHPLKKRFLCKI